MVVNFFSSSAIKREHPETKVEMGALGGLTPAFYLPFSKVLIF